MAGTAFDFIRIDVPCPQCGKNNKEPLAELVVGDAVPCRFCGEIIDLTGEDWRVSLAKQAEEFKQIKIVKDG